MTDETKKENVGWVCPRCQSVNSPQKDKCVCPKEVKENVIEDTRKLLQEMPDCRAKEIVFELLRTDTWNK